MARDYAEKALNSRYVWNEENNTTWSILDAAIIPEWSNWVGNPTKWSQGNNVTPNFVVAIKPEIADVMDSLGVNVGESPKRERDGKFYFVNRETGEKTEVDPIYSIHVNIGWHPPYGEPPRIKLIRNLNGERIEEILDESDITKLYNTTIVKSAVRFHLSKNKNRPGQCTAYCDEIIIHGSSVNSLEWEWENMGIESNAVDSAVNDGEQDLSYEY